MRTSTTTTGLIALGTIAALSACGGEGDAATSTDASAPAAASASASADAQPPGTPSTEDPERFAVDDGGYLFTLPDGGVCSVDGELNDQVGSDFACLLILDEPMKTEDGNPTTGVEYQDNLFAPSSALADPDIQELFTTAAEGAEPLGPQSELAVGDYEVRVETNDEYGFASANGGDIFMAARHVTRFWTPRPDWVPEPNFPPID